MERVKLSRFGRPEYLRIIEHHGRFISILESGATTEAQQKKVAKTKETWQLFHKLISLARGNDIHPSLHLPRRFLPRKVRIHRDLRERRNGEYAQSEQGQSRPQLLGHYHEARPAFEPPPKRQRTIKTPAHRRWSDRNLPSGPGLCSALAIEEHSRGCRQRNETSRAFFQLI